MIEYIRGKLVRLSPTSAVVEAQGIGWGASVSLLTSRELAGSEGAEVRLLVSVVSRQDGSHSMYGFVHEEEREVFTALLGASGVGAATALAILSTYAPQQVAQMAVSGDVAGFRAVHSVGAKTAQRIILDLRGNKVIESLAQGAAAGAAASGAAAGGVSVERETMAAQALAALGFTQAAAQKAVSLAASRAGGESLTVEELVKRSLKLI